MDDALGHDVVLTGFVVIGVAAAFFGLLVVTVVLVIVVEVIGIVHLGALIVVLIIVEQAAFGSVAADALGLGILVVIGVAAALGLKRGGCLLGLIGALRRDVLLTGDGCLHGVGHGARVAGSRGRLCLRLRCGSGRRGHTAGDGVDLLLLALGGLAGLLQNSGQRCLDTGAVTTALGADGGVFLIGMERTAGAEPAVLGVLGHAG